MAIYGYTNLGIEPTSVLGPIKSCEHASYRARAGTLLLSRRCRFPELLIRAIKRATAESDFLILDGAVNAAFELPFHRITSSIFFSWRPLRKENIL